MSVYDYSARSLAGEGVSLSEFKGQVLLIVNTASKCGFTPQYAELEQLYERLLPWIGGHPSYGALTGADVCTNCGSAHLQHRGYAITSTGRFRRVQCVDCGRWSRSSKAEARTGISQIAG